MKFSRQNSFSTGSRLSPDLLQVSLLTEKKHPLLWQCWNLKTVVCSKISSQHETGLKTIFCLFVFLFITDRFLTEIIRAFKMQDHSISLLVVWCLLSSHKIVRSIFWALNSFLAYLQPRCSIGPKIQCLEPRDISDPVPHYPLSQVCIYLCTLVTQEYNWGIILIIIYLLTYI